MKTLKIFFFLAFLTLLASESFAQRGRGGRRFGHPYRPYRARMVVYGPSPFRPKGVLVFHPVWGPKFVYYRRWIYWPGYNFYWDNWRNSYFFWNGAMWVASVQPPPAVINVNIQNVKHYEMKETEDDIDDVYKSNSSHQKEYKQE